MQNQGNFLQQARIIARRVYLSDNVDIKRGQAVCYQASYGTATESDPLRDKYVALPSASNNLHFAGVSLHDYDSRAGGRVIEIAEPGSLCPVLVDGSAALGDAVTALAGGATAGQFSATLQGQLGRGTARLLQTRTGAGTVLAKLLDGGESGLVESVTPVAGANTFMVGGVTVLQAATLGSAGTFTLANGKVIGMKKVFRAAGTLSTNGVAITVTSGQQHGATTALATLTFTATTGGRFALLEWTGDVWKCLALSGTSPTQG